MKENVDLTLNRDFEESDLQSLREMVNKFNSPSLKKIPSSILTAKGRKYIPWRKNYRLNGNNNEQSLMFTGSKKEINNDRYYLNMIKNECDRCGTDLSRKPWNGSGGLCMDCDQEMNRERKNINILSMLDLNRRDAV